MAAPSAHAALFYCNRVTPPGYCSEHANVENYTYDWNQSYVSNGGGLPVCERVTKRYSAANSSFRCGGSPVSSGCDLLGPYAPFEWSMYTGNNNPSGGLAEYMVGKADKVTCA